MNAIASDAEDKGRKVKETLTADVSGYVAGMEQARLVTSQLAAELRALGIAERDLPDAAKGVIALASAGGMDTSKTAGIVVTAIKDYQLRNAG
ncbi:hypothetical protein B7R21_06395 [Subtercola boreus]|uniref:Uncharacterized protein n=1 Tax=Subtercola boreus TaxID=120213 RepID=A0A3E0VXW4_9MICO|nr:hypothetical protein [Subtercola boreus]RFA14571.1 hypothetical protein B7R21_06395 [Subtercola boreus]